MEGLAKTTIPGRMEMLSQTPRVLVDGAHNAASLDAMMRAIGQHIPYDSMVVIFGCCADKDVAGMLERITSGADKVIFTKVEQHPHRRSRTSWPPATSSYTARWPRSPRRSKTPWPSPTAP